MELVDITDLKSVARKSVGVRLPPLAPNRIKNRITIWKNKLNTEFSPKETLVSVW